MSNPRRQDQGMSVALRWFLVFGVVLYGLVSMLVWPFRRAARLIPGRREKMLRDFAAGLRSAIPSATKLVQELGAGDPSLDARMAKSMSELQEALDLAATTRKWPEDLDLKNPWESAIDILERSKFVGAIDHNSDVGELKKALTPLLRKRDLKFDWAFLKDLEASRDGHALKNENLLPSIGRRLATSGYVLAQIDDGSDNYLLSLCTPDSFSRIEALTSGDYAIRQFSQTPPAA